jgi:methyl-accepting chemotaxis protein
MKERLDAASIFKDDGCDLGKWLHWHGKPKIERLTSYADCVAKHKAFHAEAGKVAATINAQEYELAVEMIGIDTPYAVASKAAVGAILHLKKEAGL